jgi:hypothetical protein
MALNIKKLKKIKRFGRLRFFGDFRYCEKVLIKIYEHADEGKRKQLDGEMDTYFKALKEGKLKPGESLLKLAVPVTKIGSET